MGRKSSTLSFIPKSLHKPDNDKQPLLVLYKLSKPHQTACVSKPIIAVSCDEKRNPNKPKNRVLVIHLLEYLLILG